MRPILVGAECSVVDVDHALGHWAAVADVKELGDVLATRVIAPRRRTVCKRTI